MTQKKKLERAFFAEKIAKKITWTDSDTERMIDFLDPVWPTMTAQEEAKHLSRRLLDFTREFEEWQAKQPKAQEPVKPMTDAEIDALAGLF